MSSIGPNPSGAEASTACCSRSAVQRRRVRPTRPHPVLAMMDRDRVWSSRSGHTGGRLVRQLGLGHRAAGSDSVHLGSVSCSLSETVDQNLNARLLPLVAFPPPGTTRRGFGFARGRTILLPRRYPIGACLKALPRDEGDAMPFPANTDMHAPGDDGRGNLSARSYTTARVAMESEDRRRGC